MVYKFLIVHTIDSVVTLLLYGAHRQILGICLFRLFIFFALNIMELIKNDLNVDKNEFYELNRTSKLEK